MDMKIASLALLCDTIALGAEKQAAVVASARRAHFSTLTGTSRAIPPKSQDKPLLHKHTHIRSKDVIDQISAPAPEVDELIEFCKDALFSITDSSQSPNGGLSD